MIVKIMTYQHLTMQSLVDMMKHYLHTSRKEKCPPEGKPSTFGQVGGNQYLNKAGGVNNLCLPNDPENEEPLKGDNHQIFEAEYGNTAGNEPSGLRDMHQQEIPCSVCHQRNKSVVLMIPAVLQKARNMDDRCSLKKTCYRGWTSEYSGYLMTDYKTASSKEYACVAKNAEPLDDKTGNEDGALFYSVSTKCGSLKCPPYKDSVEVLCVVCTK
ncbi:uncharacterized protein LOC134701660 [Mytilus trossulus]|uniref:uncharacterized protein LOC134701660 n=1 Tax=Mytilus trossulus TaxID=6551 RepID=UPI0030044814